MTDRMHTPPLTAAIASRMSMRAYLRDAVPEPTIHAILQAAADAVAGSPMPPWRVHVLQGASLASLCSAVCDEHDAMRADPRRAAAHPERYAYYPEKWFSPYIDRRRENGWGLYGLLGIGKADKDRMHAQHQRNFRCFDAPVGLFFTVTEAAGWHGLLHYGALLQNLMVAARLAGLHTCPQAAWNGFAHIVLPHVGADADHVLVCGMSLGWADPDAVVNTYATPRIPASEFTLWQD